MDVEVLLHELLVVDLRGVEGDLADLDVACVTGADLLVGGVIDVAALVADRSIDHAIQAPECLLDLPEAAGSEGGLLGNGRSGALGGHGLLSNQALSQ